MSLRIHDIEIAFKTEEDHYGVGLYLGPLRFGENGQLFCKESSVVRSLTAIAISNDDIELVSRTVRENGLVWLDFSRNKISRIVQPLCELTELQWLSFYGE